MPPEPPGREPGDPDPEDRAGLAGDPDALQRLWTPHRMVYVGGEDKSADATPRSCPFCAAPQRDDAAGLIVHRGASAYVVLNLYPYSPGHLLVCPYRHVAGYPDLTDDETWEVAELTRTAMGVVRAVSAPDGFNLGMNQGAVAGAGVAAHLHQHLVPRWAGDANFMPVVARTKALPQLLGDTRQLLADAWPSRPPAPAGHRWQDGRVQATQGGEGRWSNVSGRPGAAS